MLSFGTLFPPLMWLMLLCMCKDVYTYRLLLYRWKLWLVESSTIPVVNTVPTTTTTSITVVVGISTSDNNHQPTTTTTTSTSTSDKKVDIYSSTSSSIFEGLYDEVVDGLCTDCYCSSCIDLGFGAL